MTILVSGDASFIDSNFVIDRLAITIKLVINLGGLTYACALEYLAKIQDNPLRSFVQTDPSNVTLENRQELKVACLGEVVFRLHWVDSEQLKRLAQPLLNNGYGKYLMQLLNEKVFV